LTSCPPTCSKTKHPSGSYHTIPLLPADPDPVWIQNSISRWQGGSPSWLHPTSTNFRWFSRHSWTHAYIHQMVRPSLMDSCLRPPTQNSTFGACSCHSLHLKTVFLTIRCDSTSKQGSQISRLTTSKHISSFSRCQKPVRCTWIFSILNFQQHCCQLADKQLHIDGKKQTSDSALFQANVGKFPFKVRILNITSSSCRFILADPHIKALQIHIWQNAT
jgi:hypothetical protein